MSGGNTVGHQEVTLTANSIIFCPACGTDDFRDVSIDERPLRQAACAAPVLRLLGHHRAAEDVLDRLTLVEVINRTFYQFECNACGSQFDE
jgi:predicted nucleic-acid-binding Zn-ribbon protein